MTARPTDPGIHGLAVAAVDGGFDGNRARDADRDSDRYADPAADPELGLADLLLVLAENARLLVIEPPGGSARCARRWKSASPALGKRDPVAGCFSDAGHGGHGARCPATCGSRCAAPD